MKSLIQNPRTLCILALLAPLLSLRAGWYSFDRSGNLTGEPEAQDLLILQPVPDGGEPYAVGPGYQREIAVEKDTVAWSLKFEARAAGGKPGEYNHSLKLNLSTGPKARPFFLCGPILHGDWESYEAVILRKEDNASNVVYLTIGYGWGSSEVEVRNVVLTSTTEKPDPQTIRRQGHWYKGQQADAPWRERAQEMIEKNRKAAVQVRVVDREGLPVEGARVVLEQQTHAYQFGTAVATQLFRWMEEGPADPSRESSLLSGDAPGKANKRAEARANAKRYFEEIVVNFNYFVTENGLKGQAWAGDWAGFRIEDTFASIDWLLSKGLEGKGHVLVWPGWRNAPEYMKAAADNPAALEALVEAHIADMGSSMNGKLAAFDVLNEPFNNNDFMRILGDEVMADWFKQAEQFLPEARLCLNDFLLFSNGGQWTEKLDFYDELIASLLKEGAPLDVVGFQNHYRHNFLTAPERIWELCDRFGEYGLPLECSEFDVIMEDELLQAAYTRDFLTAWFAHPSTRAFLFWGFWESAHWLPQAALLTSDWREKPNYHAYRNLVFNEWWTGWEEDFTNKDGACTQRGFLGKYRITVTHNGVSKSIDNLELAKGGLELVVRL
ncbi:hypothetical protein G0Q06_12130 [Puniceicoccales bacterium CK1056]|uniref:endo-1,4-beta-xylanase n=1 Tax=Oceanipulchritudo coccoides TaxID=2706888 RepID=A0A6B2M529_9BACT|nr:endo-1,4-beta-xylanase [Oceanipulchritudo coccoides]NDV63204.1 hypothetical protein [Oceanipulchritudo coccoides]